MPGSRTIFVANLPYDVSEEQLGNVFSEVGPVNSVEIKFDPQTGRSKGYAFVQYMDEATAASAVRNLQDVPVNGRNLRVETSDDSKAEGGGMGGGPGGRRGQGGGAGRGRGVGGPGGDRRSADIGPGGPGGPGGPYFDRSRGGRSPPPMGMGMGGHPAGGGYGRGPGGPDGHPPFPPSMGGPMNPGMGGPMGGIDSKPLIDMNALPPGQDVPPGQKATDIISKTLAAITPGQMQDVMMGMKTLVSTQPDQARLLLQSKPQLAYALFQAMLLMNIVDASVLQRIQPVSNTQFPPAPAPGPPAAYPPYPPQNQPAPSYPPYNRAPVDPRQPPHQAQGYNAPPFPPRAAPGPALPASIPPHAQAALATLPEDQRTMLIQVLQLTPDQVNALDATQKASIVQLRQQFLGTA